VEIGPISRALDRTGYLKKMDAMQKNTGPTNNQRAAGRSRRVLLAPARRAELVAVIDRGIDLLVSDPVALREVIDDGLFLDVALAEPVIEE
jgi:hypothetical protein